MLNIQTLQSFFLYGFLINIGLLTWWFLWLFFAHDWVYRMHTKWFKLSPETFDAIHYSAAVVFKIATIMFFLVPYLVLKIVS